MTLHAWMPRSHLVAVVAALAVLFALPQTCFACSCIAPPPPTEAAADAVAVFQGEVIRVEQVRGATGAEHRRVTLRVSKVWKGTITAETIVYTGSGDANCGIAFQQGTEYVIYANASNGTDFWGTPANSLVTGLCDRTRPVAEAADDLAALGPGQPPTPSLPNTGTGTIDAATSSQVIPVKLLIGGGILAFLAIIWRSRPSRQTAQ
jgi:hypothetical protein